ncbi:hypothetical protein [Paraburkholderia flava]|nr:hypothetical protein [Paraburkholderia flava]
MTAAEWLRESRVRLVPLRCDDVAQRVLSQRGAIDVDIADSP